MALRLYTEIPDEIGSKMIRIEVYDTEYSGDPIEIDTQGGGVSYKDVGASNLDRPRIVPRTAQVIMLVDVQDVAHKAFVDDLRLSDEGRFFLKTLHGGTTEFIGMILVEQNEVESSANLHIKYTIGATDGLTLMKNKPYLAAQGQPYIDQELDGHLHVNATLLASVILDADGQGSKRDLWHTVTDNVGGHFDPATGVYSGYQGKVDVSIFMDIIGEHDDFQVRNSGPLMGKLIKIKDDNSTITETVIEEVEVEFDQPLGQRRIIRINQAGISLDIGESLVCELSWDLRTKTDLGLQVNSFWSIKVDQSASVKNIYASLFAHVGRLFGQLPTRDFYESDEEFYGILVPWTEENQGSVRGENYIGIPYNAFTKDVAASPPSVLSVYDALAEIAKLLGGFVRYRQGHYEIVPYFDVSTRHRYDRHDAYLGSVTNDFNTDVVCVGSATEGALPPIGEAKITFDRQGSLNLLSGAIGRIKEPGYTYSRSVNLVNEALYLTVSIRLLGEQSNTPNYDAIYPVRRSIHRHVFEASLKIGDYVYIYNQDPDGPLLDIIYNIPEFTPVDQKITLYAKPQEPTDLIHDLVLTYSLPPVTYSGDLEFSLRYKDTITPSGTVVVPEPLNYEVLGVLLRRFSDGDLDKIYSERIVAQVSNQNNSFEADDTIIASDLWELENDPGAIMVHNGSEFVKSGLWSGTSLQMQIARWLAARQQRSADLYNGSFRTFSAQSFDIEHDGRQWVYLAGDYNAGTGILRGQWVEDMPLDIGTRMDQQIYTEAQGDTQQTQSINGLSKAPVSDSAPTSEGSEIKNYYHYVKGIDTDTIVMPPEKPLPLEGFDEDVYIRAFLGSMRGSANIIYRSTPMNPSQFTRHPSVDNAIQLYRAARPGDEYFFIWIR